MKIAAIIVLALLLIFLGVQIVSYVKQDGQLSGELSDMQSKLMTAQTNEANLQAENNYLANPTNLEKELRDRFNYKSPGETMVIIVPSQSSTVTSSTYNITD